MSLSNRKRREEEKQQEDGRQEGKPAASGWRVMFPTRIEGPLHMLMDGAGVQGGLMMIPPEQ